MTESEEVIVRLRKARTVPATWILKPKAELTAETPTIENVGWVEVSFGDTKNVVPVFSGEDGTRELRFEEARPLFKGKKYTAIDKRHNIQIVDGKQIPIVPNWMYDEMKEKFGMLDALKNDVEDWVATQKIELSNLKNFRLKRLYARFGVDYNYKTNAKKNPMQYQWFCQAIVRLQQRKHPGKSWKATKKDEEKKRKRDAVSSTETSDDVEAAAAPEATAELKADAGAGSSKTTTVPEAGEDETKTTKSGVDEVAVESADEAPKKAKKQKTKKTKKVKSEE